MLEDFWCACEIAGTFSKQILKECVVLNINMIKQLCNGVYVLYVAGRTMDEEKCLKKENFGLSNSQNTSFGPWLSQ